MTDPTLPEKVLRLHKALKRRKLPHAFGGALALAYCTEEPRATRDIDVNVFVGKDDIEAAVPSAATTCCPGTPVQPTDG